MVFCVSYLRRMWREEPWGYPQRPQAAILSLKFPAGVTSPALTRTYRLLFAVGWSFWVFYSVYGTFHADRTPRTGLQIGPDLCARRSSHPIHPHD